MKPTTFKVKITNESGNHQWYYYNIFHVADADALDYKIRTYTADYVRSGVNGDKRVCNIEFKIKGEDVEILTEYPSYAEKYKYCRIFKQAFDELTPEKLIILIDGE